MNSYADRRWLCCSLLLAAALAGGGGVDKDVGAGWLCDRYDGVVESPGGGGDVGELAHAFEAIRDRIIRINQ